MKTTTSLLLLSLFITCIFAAGFVYKHPQEEPSQFGHHKQPTPEQTATHSGAAMLDIELKEVNGKAMWKAEVPVDSEKELSISIISPIYKDFTIQVLPPSETALRELRTMGKEIVENFGIDGATFPSHTFLLSNVPKGIWQILITSTTQSVSALKKQQTKPNLPQGKVIVGNFSPYRVEAHLADLQTLKDSKIGFELRLVDSNQDRVGHLHAALNVPLHVEMDIYEPNGEEITVEMHDDGLRGDRIANDGIYYADFQADQDGQYISKMIVLGKDPKGNPLMRTTEIAFQVVSDNIDVNGAYAKYDETNQVFDIFLKLDKTALAKSKTDRFKVWSEVWGQNSAGKYVPVASVSGYTDLQTDSNGNSVLGRIELNHRWLVKAGVTKNLQFRDLRISDPDWTVLIDKFQQLDIEISEIPELKLSQRDEPMDVITKSMKYGWEAAKMMSVRSNATAPYKFRVILVHGYCAQSNPFNDTDFTNASLFLGALRESISNDQFARRIITFMGQTADSAALIAHSQGGMASTHLRNYYLSQLDLADNGKRRLIQSVGTPYQGSALAGGVADLGTIFGVGCGSNNDLSFSGAASWLSQISVDAQKQVYYYTTQYGTGNIVNYCNLAANAVLKWPNDGVTEVAYSVLPSGNSQPKNPLKEWCHTTDMRHPPQCSDKSRNSEMDSYANLQ